MKRVDATAAPYVGWAVRPLAGDIVLIVDGRLCPLTLAEAATIHSALTGALAVAHGTHPVQTEAERL